MSSSHVPLSSSRALGGCPGQARSDPSLPASAFATREGFPAFSRGWNPRHSHRMSSVTADEWLNHSRLPSFLWGPWAGPCSSQGGPECRVMTRGAPALVRAPQTLPRTAVPPPPQVFYHPLWVYPSESSRSLFRSTRRRRVSPALVGDLGRHTPWGPAPSWMQREPYICQLSQSHLLSPGAPAHCLGFAGAAPTSLNCLPVRCQSPDASNGCFCQKSILFCVWFGKSLSAPAHLLELLPLRTCNLCPGTSLVCQQPPSCGGPAPPPTLWPRRQNERQMGRGGGPPDASLFLL